MQCFETFADFTFDHQNSSRDLFDEVFYSDLTATDSDSNEHENYFWNQAPSSARPCLESVGNSHAPNYFWNRTTNSDSDCSRSSTPEQEQTHAPNYFWNQCTNQTCKVGEDSETCELVPGYLTAADDDHAPNYFWNCSASTSPCESGDDARDPMEFVIDMAVPGASRKRSSGSKPRSRVNRKAFYWTPEDHAKFVKGLEKFGLQNGLGPNGAELMSAYMGNRTALQIKSHMQKHLSDVAKLRMQAVAF